MISAGSCDAIVLRVALWRGIRDMVTNGMCGQPSVKTSKQMKKMGQVKPVGSLFWLISLFLLLVRIMYIIDSFFF